ncbi:MAG: TIGR00341 family protein [Salinibacter sp.]
MALRLVDIYRSDTDEALELPDDAYDVLGHWTHPIDDEQRVDRVLLEVDETESFLDWLDGALATEYRVVLQSVEATLPRPEVEEDDEEEAEDEEEVSVGRIGRAELYEYARDAADVSGVYYALIALATIVAAGGMLRNQTAVVIGAMVIAPLIGPNLALALGTTLGDTELLGRATWSTVSGVGLTLVGAVGLGVLVPVNPATGELAARTVIGAADIALAAAAGSAGALSVTRGGATGLVGVMVAVALIPPLVATGLLLGAGYTGEAVGAGLLTVTNVVSLNLAAVCTFLVLGVWPRHWRDVEQARTSTRIALVLWGGALLVLALILWWGV